MIRRLLVALLLVTPLAAPAAHAAALADTAAVAAAARKFTPFVSRGEPGPLWTAFDATMRTALKDSTSFAGVMASLHASLGALDHVEKETIVQQSGNWVYVARSRFAKPPVPIDLVISFDPAGLVSGLVLRPSADAGPAKPYASTHLDYVTKTELHLPFHGTWDVFWGGRTVEQNYHAAYRDQRFAHDILILKDGSSHKGDGTKLSDYWCYGLEILAPGAGTVVWSVDSLPDNAPGQRDPAHATGNSLVIDHGNGEYSVIAHLQPHSLRVHAGDHVTAGMVVGLCGNSGNTTEPHVHYHLQDTPRLFDGDGLPVQFTELIVDGKPVARAEILKGQRVSNAK